MSKRKKDRNRVKRMTRVVTRIGNTTVIADPDETYVLTPSNRSLKEPFQVGDHFAWVCREIAVEAGGKRHTHPMSLVIYGTVKKVRGGVVEGPCFSRSCMEGEYGDTPIKAIQVRLSPSEFAYAKAYGWPNDAFAQACVANGVAP